MRAIVLAIIGAALFISGWIRITDAPPEAEWWQTGVLGVFGGSVAMVIAYFTAKRQP